MQEHLKDPELQNCGLLAELAMPASGERADFILVGGNDTAPKGLILEMKQWSGPQKLFRDKFVKNTEGDWERHPIIQALGYRGKLLCFSEIGASISWQCCGMLPNMEEDGIAALRGSSLLEHALDWQLFGKNDISEFSAYVKRHLGYSSISKTFIQRLEQAPYQQTKHYFRFVVENHKLIEKRMFAALAAEGFALTEEQDLLCEGVVIALEQWRTRQKKTVFLIQGGAGSGKTLVALTLFLRHIKQYQSGAILGLTGKWMKGNIEDCFEKIYPGLSGSVKNVHQLQKAQLANIELIVCDETQRLEANGITNVLSHAPVVVAFLDEHQQLTPKEKGCHTAFESAIKSARNPKFGLTHEIKLYTLEAPVRCRGGAPYHLWIEQLLTRKPAHSICNQWYRDYRFEIFTTFDAMKAALYEVRECEKRRVALVASFTESPGNRDNPYNPYALNNLRVGKDLEKLKNGYNHYKDTLAEVYWMMNKQEYVDFWNEGESSKLERTATVYGAQGFESDYVGVIWGRDYVYRNGQFMEGERASYTDSVGYLLAYGKKHWHKEALRLLRNRYRIFLTRGLLGTFIYCEDEETRAYLMDAVMDTQATYVPPHTIRFS